jgi:hypothetical protein
MHCFSLRMYWLRRLLVRTSTIRWRRFCHCCLLVLLCCLPALLPRHRNQLLTILLSSPNKTACWPWRRSIFFKQTSTNVRKFYLTHSTLTPNVNPDGDPNHVGGASGGAYLEILPDTRRNHGHKLITGENFSPYPGKLAVLHYKVNISTPGKYYVWFRRQRAARWNRRHVAGKRWR